MSYSEKPRLVRIVIDPNIPAGRYRVGGVRIADPQDDAELGRELRTSEVGCHSEEDAANLRQIIARDPHLELETPRCKRPSCNLPAWRDGWCEPCWDDIHNDGWED